MCNKYNLIFILFLILFASCKEEQIYNTISPSINISHPNKNFLVEEYDSLYIHIETNIIEFEIERIELIVWSSDIFEDTLITVFNQHPFEEYLYIPKMCIESSYIFLSANLILKSGKEKNSELLWGRVFKNLPANSEMNIYNYEGFDNDSILAVQGSLSIVKGYWPPGFNNNLLGRRDIVAIADDSTFEKGKGFLEGFIRQNGSFGISLLPCNELGALKNVQLQGSWYSDSLLSGIRVYYPDSGPVGTILGTFKAVKIN